MIEMFGIDLPKSVYILLSFFIGIIFVAYLRSKDRYEKEPYSILLAVTALGGGLAIIVSLYSYELLAYMGIEDLHNGLGAILVIGPIEELSKLLALFAAYPFIRKHMDEPVDGMVYMACVALGFSLIENYFYATGTPDSGYLLWLRLALSSPTHITDSIFMGLAFWVWIQNRHNVRLLFISFFYASAIHGLFDAGAFTDDEELAGLFVLVAMVISLNIGIGIFKYALSLSPFRVPIKDFVASFETPEFEEGLYCEHCGSKNKKMAYKNRHFIIQKCDGCEHYLATIKQIMNIFYHYTGKAPDNTQPFSVKYLGLNEAKINFGLFTRGEKPLFFDLELLNSTLENINNSLAEVFISRIVPKKILLSIKKP